MTTIRMSSISHLQPSGRPDTEKPVLEPLPTQSLENDVEKQVPLEVRSEEDMVKTSAFKSLGLLDKFLAVWIFLAMVIGILLGNFVPNTAPALEKGQFVGVSIPISEQHGSICSDDSLLMVLPSHWLACYDVPDLVQSAI